MFFSEKHSKIHAQICFLANIIENHKKTKQDKEYNVILDKFSQGEDLTLEEKEVLKNYKK